MALLRVLHYVGWLWIMIGIADVRCTGYPHPKSKPYRPPYAFGHHTDDGYGTTAHRYEHSDPHDGSVKGSYGYSDSTGQYRTVYYVADGDGFKANVKTNEPGTDNQNPAHVEIASYPPSHAYPSYPKYPQSSSSYGYQPKYPQSKYPQPHYPHPKYPQPHYHHSKYPQPHYPHPKYPQPKYPQPKYPQPKYPQPNHPQPKPTAQPAAQKTKPLKQKPSAQKQKPLAPQKTKLSLQQRPRKAKIESTQPTIKYVLIPKCPYTEPTEAPTTTTEIPETTTQFVEEGEDGMMPDEGEDGMEEVDEEPVGEFGFRLFRPSSANDDDDDQFEESTTFL